MAEPQQIIGHYHIVSKLGEGGMGEVWRATDTRLNREVAVKVLSAAFAEDPMRMARFAREAQVLASLNHPGIAAIYGVEERALVMELVEGPTLAERIARGAVPLDEALPIAAQIAEALEYAHEKGVVHRDLKPANIKVTPEGRVKILDFGLAKAMSADASASVVGEAPTLSSPATLAGTILGTAAYMSPEQARGQNVDRRADIWAFGVVLCEMLTGERLFVGPTVSDTLAAVLRSEPALDALPPVPRAVVQGCLRKDVRGRWQAIGDVRLALTGTLPTVSQAPPPRRRTALLTAAGALVVVLAAALAAVHFRPAPPIAPLLRFTITPPANTSIVPSSAPAISPDGSTIAYAAVGADQVQRIYLRRLDGATAAPLSGTEGASRPFWSPDSRFLGFWRDGSLDKMDLAGGPPVRLADAPHMSGASWGAGGVIVFSPSGSGPLFRVPAAGGTPVPATVLDRSHGEIADVLPAFLPDGRHFLYVAFSPALVGTIYVGSLDATPARPLTTSMAGPAYASGNLLFLRHNNTLMAQPFDPGRQALTGEMAPVAAVGRSDSLGEFTASAGGILAYEPARATQTSLAWYDRSGHPLGPVGTPGQHLGLTLSPNGKSAIVTEIDENRSAMDLWLYDLSRNLSSPFVIDFAMTMNGVWSPDGRQIAFSGARQSINGDLYRESADDVGTPELLHSDNSFKVPTSWSPDGKYLLYESELAGVSGVWALPMTGAPKPVLVANGGEGVFSPDGRWVAYVSDETDRDEVFITPFPGPGPRLLVSTAGGTYPRWRADGKELFYLAPDNKLMAAELAASASPPSIGAVHALFSPTSGTIDGEPPYAVTGAGQRFLVLTATGATAQPPLNVIVNWPAALKH